MNGRRLYEEIGGVDERYLQEAAYYHVRKKSSSWRVLLVAAVLMLAGALVIGTIGASVAIGIIGNLIWGDSNDIEPPNENVEDELSALAQMEMTMQAKQDEQNPISADELVFFDNTPTLIWSQQGSHDYYSVTLSDHQCEELVYLMQTHRRTYTEQSEAPKYQIWLSFGDGLVVSPYLKNTAGNAGHGMVFDYDPELELSDDLAKLIAHYIET